MILWNRDFSCNRKLTANDRMAIAKTIATSDTRFWAQVISYLVNFVVLAITYMAFGFNLIALAAAFVATDLVLTVIDNLVFVYIPRSITMNSSLKTSQRRVKRITAKRDALKNTIQKFKDKECASCTSRHSWRSKCCDCYTKETKDIDIMTRFIEQEQFWIDKQLEAVKQKEVEEQKAQEPTFPDRTEYFSAIKASLTVFEKTHGVTFLSDIIKEIDELIITLQKKPVGYSLISGTLYAYLDELQNILNKWVELDEQQKLIYLNDIMRISDALCDNIQSLNQRIIRLETEDIEVGIAVLLKELTDDNNNSKN